MVAAHVIVHDHRDPWDAADIRALLVWVDRGLTYREIADRMGRTVGAVRSKLYRLRKS